MIRLTLKVCAALALTSAVAQADDVESEFDSDALFARKPALRAGALAFAGTYSPAHGVGRTFSFANDFSFRGFGAELRYFITEHLSADFTTSWTFIDDKVRSTISRDNVALTATQIRSFQSVPLLFGAHYYVPLAGGRVTPNLGAGLGPTWTRREVDTGLNFFGDSDWHLGLSADAGTLIDLGSMQLLLSVRATYAPQMGQAQNEAWLSYNVGLLGF